MKKGRTFTCNIYGEFRETKMRDIWCELFFRHSFNIARSCRHQYFENNDCNSIEIKEQKKIKAKLSLGKVSDIVI